MPFSLFGCFKGSSSDFTTKKDRILNQLRGLNWDEPEKIFELVESQVLIEETNKEPKIGCSKYGGTPDLPTTLNWPKFNNRSMVFFAQLNLGDLSILDDSELLPKKGMLYFFSHYKEPENEFGAEYLFLIPKEEYSVLYFDGDIEQLTQSEFPEDVIDLYKFKETPINFELKYYVPVSFETWKLENANLSDNDTNIYDEFISQYDDCESEMILGTPCPIQYGVDYDWAFSYLDLHDYNDPVSKQKIDSIRPEFINLLSFPMWNRFEAIGGANCYFGITKKDLKDKKFENVVFIMQDT